MYKLHKFMFGSLASYLILSSCLTFVDAVETAETIDNKSSSLFNFSSVDTHDEFKNLKKKSLLKKRKRSLSCESENLSEENDENEHSYPNDNLRALEDYENLKCPKCHNIVKDNPTNFIRKGTIKGGSYNGNQIFKCKSCNITFHKDTPDPIEKYLKTLTNPEDLQCPLCHTNVMSNLEHFNDFFVLHGLFTSGPHKGKQKFFCKKCKRNFFEGSLDNPPKVMISLDEHLKTLEHPEDLKCPKCFSSKFSLHGFVPSGTHKGERRYQCKECNTNFHAWALKDVSKFRGNLLPHLQKLRDPDNFKCPRCNTLVKDNLDNFKLKGLVRSGSSKGKQKFFCKKCNYAFYETFFNIIKSPHISLEQRLSQIANSETLHCPGCNKIVKENMKNFKIAGYNYSKDNKKIIKCLCKSCNKYFCMNSKPKSSIPEGLKCPNCSNETNFRKSGTKGSKQRYFCKSCNHDFAPECKRSSYGTPLPFGLVCPKCNSQKNIIRKGFIDPETKKISKYYCKECKIHFSKRSDFTPQDFVNVNDGSIRIPSRGNLNSSILFNKLACPFCNVSNVLKHSSFGSNVELYCKCCNKYFKKPIINALCEHCGMLGRVISTGNNIHPYICIICGKFEVTPPDPFYLQGFSIKPKSQTSPSRFDFNYDYGSNNSQYNL